MLAAEHHADEWRPLLARFQAEIDGTPHAELAAQAETLPEGSLRTAILDGIRLLPQWRHRLGAENRARALLLLALAGRHMGPH